MAIQGSPTPHQVFVSGGMGCAGFPAEFGPGGGGLWTAPGWPSPEPAAPNRSFLQGGQAGVAIHRAVGIRPDGNYTRPTCTASTA